MTDELKRLEEALRGRLPEPEPQARERALAAALAAFDAADPQARQGSRTAERPMGRASIWLGNLFKRSAMNLAHANFRYRLVGAAGLAVLAVVIAARTLITDPVSVYGPEENRHALSSSPAKQPMGELSALGEAVPASLPERSRKPKESIESLMNFMVSSNRSDDATDEDPYTDLVREHLQGRDRFPAFGTNPVKAVAREPVSTFSIDVDTASYGFVRAALNRGVLPPPEAVRVEELINYFPYDYEAPKDRQAPFAVGVSLMPTPWNLATRLMHIGIRGYALAPEAKPRTNLVFLIDTSGSMHEPERLPLLVRSLKLLLDSLAPDDTVAIAAYAGSAGVVLEPTRAAERRKILAALDGLDAGGSTAGAEGLRLAYQLAEQNFAEDRINRVILATDGDFNVGVSDPEEMERYVARKRATGVFLSVLGFGMGNYHDEMMQTLAQNGNGHAAYIDSLSEARKVLVEEATSTLFPIAKDVKVQVEFNPALVSEYRLIGYETRRLAREDFTDDKVDAGEIGAGHTVTAIYELTPAGSGAERMEPSRYQPEAGTPDPRFAGEYAFLKIRYKLPDRDDSTLITRTVTRADEAERVGDAPQEARFAAAVAGFGQLLRRGRYTGAYGYDDVLVLARDARGEDRFGYRAEFLNLVRLAQSAAALEAQQP